MGTNLEQKIDVTIVNTFIWKNLEEIWGKIMISDIKLMRIHNEIEEMLESLRKSLADPIYCEDKYREGHTVGWIKGLRIVKNMLDEEDK